MSKPTFAERLNNFKVKARAFADRINTPFVQRVGNKVISKKHLYPSFFFPFMLLMIVYAALGFWPVGNRSMLTLDMSAQYIFYFEQIRDVLMGQESLIYTFERTLGGEFLGYYAYYIASPLSWLVCLFPARMMVEAVTFILMLKASLSGFFFAYYIEKTRKSTDVVGLTMFSTMYALCAYAMAYQTNTMWMDALMFLPLVTLGIERLVTDGKYKLFIVTFALTVWSNFYIGYMCCFYVLFYTICFICAHSDEEINGLNEAKHKLKSILRVGICSVISLLICMTVILSAYYALSFGKSDFQTSNFEPFLRFDFLDLFAKFFFGAYDTVRPDGTPNMYSGTLMLLMIPVYFISKKVSARHKIAYGGFVALFVTIMSVNTLDLVMHGFQMPVWLNYRYSFMLTFVLLTLAYRGYEYIKEVDSKFLFQTGAFLIFALMVMQKTVELTRYQSGGIKWESEYIPDYEYVWLSILLIGIYLAVLYFVKNSKSVKKTATTVLLLVVLAEAGIGAGLNWGHQVYEVGYGYRNAYVEFLEKMQPTVDEVLESDKSFYRFEKNQYRKNNENLALNINGIAASTSTLNANVIELLRNMGFCASSHWAKYFCGNEVADSLLGIKYVISEEGNHVSSLYNGRDSKDGLQIFTNPYALSIAFAANNNAKDLILTPVQKISPFDYLDGMLTQLSGANSSLKVFTKCNYSITSNVGCSIRYTGGSAVIARTGSGSALYEYTVTTNESGSLYMHFLATARNSAVTYRVNGEEVTTVFDTDTTRIHNLGYFEKGTEVKVSFEFDKGNSVSFKSDAPIFVQVNKEKLESAIGNLQKGNLIITDHSDTRIEGTITAEEGQYVFTSIPYDKYWNVYVDGERVETYSTMDTLLSFDIEAGQHEIKMVYVSKPFYIGLCFTALGIGLFVALIILEKKLGFKVIPVWVRETEGADGTDMQADSEVPEAETKEAPAQPLAEGESNNENNENTQAKEE